MSVLGHSYSYFFHFAFQTVLLLMLCAYAWLMCCDLFREHQEPYFTTWHFKGWNWRSLRNRGCGQTSATVCLPYRSLVSDFLTFLYLIFSTLKSANWCQWTEGGVVCGVRFHGTPHCALTGTESKRARLVLLRSRGSGEINPCDPAALGEIWLSVEQRCCRGQCRPEQVQPPLAYLWAPLSTKLPWSKSAESGVKKKKGKRKKEKKNVFTIWGGQGLEDR